jgi:hypothetical protein
MPPGRKWSIRVRNRFETRKGKDLVIELYLCQKELQKPLYSAHLVDGFYVKGAIGVALPLQYGIIPLSAHEP